MCCLMPTPTTPLHTGLFHIHSTSYSYSQCLTLACTQYMNRWVDGWMDNPFSRCRLLPCLITWADLSTFPLIWALLGQLLKDKLQQIIYGLIQVPIDLSSLLKLWKKLEIHDLPEVWCCPNHWNPHFFLLIWALSILTVDFFYNMFLLHC